MGLGVTEDVGDVLLFSTYVSSTGRADLLEVRPPSGPSEARRNHVLVVLRGDASVALLCYPAGFQAKLNSLWTEAARRACALLR